MTHKALACIAHHAPGLVAAAGDFFERCRDESVKDRIDGRKLAASSLFCEFRLIFAWAARTIRPGTGRTDSGACGA
jgi:hypothetical protein